MLSVNAVPKASRRKEILIPVIKLAINIRKTGLIHLLIKHGRKKVFHLSYINYWASVPQSITAPAIASGTCVCFKINTSGINKPRKSMPVSSGNIYSNTRPYSHEGTRGDASPTPPKEYGSGQKSK